MLSKIRDKKRKGLFKDRKLLYELLSYADKEDYDILTSTANFIDIAEKIGVIKDDSQEEDNSALDTLWYGVLGFLVEDHIGRVEKLFSKKEQAEKDKPSSPTDNSPNSPSPKPSPEYKNNLEAEVKRLQDQISELENKVNDNTNNPTQKETYQKILDNTKRSLDDKKKEKDKFEKPEPKSTSPSGDNSSNKLN